MSLRGQLIVLSGVQSPAAPGAVKLNVSPADRIASTMPYIHRAMAPKSLVALAGGGVAGNCRVTGEALLQKGASPSALQLTLIEGKPALGFSTANVLCALAFQPGSATASYTLVMLVAIAETPVIKKIIQARQSVRSSLCHQLATITPNRPAIRRSSLSSRRCKKSMRSTPWWA